MEIITGVRYEVPVSANVISAAGHDAVQAFLVERIGRRLPPRFDWHWLVTTDNLGLRGKFPVRVSKFMAEWHGIKLSKEDLSTIGTLAGEHILPDDTYSIDFTHDFDWNAGDFGDRGSCFWGGRHGARSMLKRAHGAAVRFWRDGHGYGRAWLVPHRDWLVSFNAYGVKQTVVGQVLATHFGCFYKQVRVTNHDRPDGTLWINEKGKGILIGSRAPEISRVELGIPEPSTCNGCGGAYYRDELTRVGYRLYCERCMPYYVRTCENCQKSCEFIYAQMIDGRVLCGACADHRGNFCHSCMRFSVQGERREGFFYCADCLPYHATCRVCGVHFDRRRSMEPDRCPSCRVPYYRSCCGWCHRVTDILSSSNACPLCESLVHRCTSCHANFLDSPMLRGFPASEVCSNCHQ